MTHDDIHKGITRLAKDSALNLIQQIWSLGVGITTSILVARGLGIEDRGGYAIVVLFAGIIFIFLNSGLEPAIVYFTAKKDKPLLESVRISFALTTWTSLIGMLVSSAIVVGLSPILFPTTSPQLLLLSVILLPAMLYANNLQIIFRGVEDFRTFNLIEMTSQPIALVLTFVFVWSLHYGITGAIAAIIIRHCYTITITLILLRTRIGESNFATIRLNREYTAKYFSYGARAYVFYIVAFLNQRLDVFLLNLFTVSKSSIALYDIAVTLGEKLWMLSRSASLVIFSRIAASEASNESRSQLTTIVTRHIFWFSLVSSSIVFVAADWGVRLLYGAAYAQSALALRLILPGLVMLSVGQIISNDLAGRGKPETVAKQSVIGVIINIIVNVILIPKMSFSGASIASTISYSIMTLLYIYTFHQITGVKWRDLILPNQSDVELWKKAFNWLRGKLRVTMV